MCSCDSINASFMCVRCLRAAVLKLNLCDQYVLCITDMAQNTIQSANISCNLFQKLFKSIKNEALAYHEKVKLSESSKIKIQLCQFVFFDIKPLLNSKKNLNPTNSLSMVHGHLNLLTYFFIYD